MGGRKATKVYAGCVRAISHHRCSCAMLVSYLAPPMLVSYLAPPMLVSYLAPTDARELSRTTDARALSRSPSVSLTTLSHSLTLCVVAYVRVRVRACVRVCVCVCVCRDVVVESWKCGMRKPDPEIFRHACRLLKVCVCVCVGGGGGGVCVCSVVPTYTADVFSRLCCCCFNRRNTHILAKPSCVYIVMYIAPVSVSVFGVSVCQ